MSMIGYYKRLKNEKLQNIIKSKEKTLGSLFKDENGESTLDIDKSWHGIHFLLTGSPWEGKPPLSYVVLGGQPMDIIDMEYGPPRYITNEQVKEVYKALIQLPIDEIVQSYNAVKFEAAEIYPGIWGEEGQELEYLLNYINQIISFLELAVKNDQSIIFYIM